MRQALYNELVAILTYGAAGIIYLGWKLIRRRSLNKRCTLNSDCVRFDGHKGEHWGPV